MKPIILTLFALIVYSNALYPPEPYCPVFETVMPSMALLGTWAFTRKKLPSYGVVLGWGVGKVAYDYFDKGKFQPGRLGYKLAGLQLGLTFIWVVE